MGEQRTISPNLSDLPDYQGHGGCAARQAQNSDPSTSLGGQFMYYLTKKRFEKLIHTRDHFAPTSLVMTLLFFLNPKL